MNLRSGSENTVGTIPRLLAAAFFLTVVALSGWRTLNLLNQPGQRKLIGMQDFRDAAYYPVVSLLANENPYDSVKFTRRYPVKSEYPPYAPTSLLVHLPFGLMPQRAAEAAYFFFSLMLTLVLAALSMKIAGLNISTTGVLVIGGLVLLSRPGHQNLLLGQLSLPAVLFSTIALQMSRQRPGWGGMCAALSLGKPTYGLPILGLLLLRREYRAFVWGCGIAVVLNLSVLLVIANNNGGIAELFATLRDSATGFQSQNAAGSPVISFSRIDVQTTIGRITGQRGPVWIVPVLMLTMIGLTGWILQRSGQHQIPKPGVIDPQPAATTSAGLPCLAILLSVYHQPHSMLLMVPFMVCLWTSITQPGGRTIDRVVFVLLASVFANYAATASVLNRLGGMESPLWLPITSFNGCILLIVFAILSVQALRPPTRN